jgi:hypothetical protein
MTVHYIDDNWILRQHHLGYFLHEGKTTVTVIKDDYLKKLFNELGLEHLHVEVMTTDTEGKMNAFGVQLYEGFKIEHLYCVDHTIQLTAKLACDDKNFGLDAEGNTCKLIQKCKAIVGHYRSSTQAAQTLKEKLRTAGIRFEVLVQDTRTRWWSTYDMLERIYHSKTCQQSLEMEDEISLSKENYLTESEWMTIPSLLELLKPFKQD